LYLCPKSKGMTRLLCGLLALFLMACGNDTEQRRADAQKAQKKQEQVFSTISRSWTFRTDSANPASQQYTQSWEAWRVLMQELSQKPQSTLGAFRKKAKTLSAKANDLGKFYPPQLNKPEIKSRVAVLTTKIHALNLYMNLADIPESQVLALIDQINIELDGIRVQIDEIDRRSRIRTEEGESDMIRMLDTARAIKAKPQLITP
jgi:hypothetical protein